MAAATRQNDPENIQLLAAKAVELISQFLRQSSQSDAPIAQLKDPRLTGKAIGLDRILSGEARGAESGAKLLADYLDAATRVHDPRFMAHQVAVPYPESALGDFVHGVTNNGYATYEMGSQAAAMELAAVDWFLSKIGWKEGSGLLTHGGSLANLTALLSARADAFPDAWESGTPAEAVLLAPGSSHYSVERTAAILGLGTKRVLDIPLDGFGAVCPDGLDRMLQMVKAKGQKAIAVVANACATATGYFDPLEPIAQVCQDRGVWLHVDGCHGASVLISEKHRHRVKGIEGANSVSWDAHKLLGTSALCAAVLFRDEKSVYKTFAQNESYLSGGAEGEKLPFLRSLECTKSGLGLRLMMVLAVHGEQRLAADLETMFQNAQDLYQMLFATPGIEVAMPPQSNIVLFRPEVPNEAIEPLRRTLIDDGVAYLSSADFAGRRWLRACLMNPETGHKQFTSICLAVLDAPNPTISTRSLTRPN